MIKKLQNTLKRRIKDDVILIDDACCFGSGGYPEEDSLQKTIAG